jgi:hypothetical protein
MTSLRIYYIIALQFHSFDKCISHLTIPIYFCTALASVRNWSESNNNNNQKKKKKNRVNQFIQERKGHERKGQEVKYYSRNIML